MNTTAKLRVDAALLSSVLVTFGSGLVLFLALHAGPARLRSEAFGLSRVAWVNLHGLGALATVTALLLHASANARAIARRATALVRGRLTRPGALELLFYLALATVCVTGVAAWLHPATEIPVFGPALPWSPGDAHHHWVDAHNLAALLSLVLTVRHVHARWPALEALRKATPGVWRRQETRTGVRSHRETAFITIARDRCTACEQCTTVCPRHVLGIVAAWRHRHVHVDRASDCKGCLECVRACASHAIAPKRPLAVPSLGARGAE
jgi:Pyruvate/2-oxoacid:ferredoxin oxidoreductase delta subunit